VYGLIAEDQEVVSNTNKRSRR